MHFAELKIKVSFRSVNVAVDRVQEVEQDPINICGCECDWGINIPVLPQAGALRSVVGT